MEVGQGRYGLLIALKSEISCFAILKIDKNPKNHRTKISSSSQLYT